jgi:hypothetical protein
MDELEAMLENEIDRVVVVRSTYVKHVTDAEIELLTAIRRVREAERRLELNELSLTSSDARLSMLNKALTVAKADPGLVRREEYGYSITVDGDEVFVVDPEAHG